MILGEGVVGLLLLGLWLFCIIDVITTDESRIRNLPKLVWVFIVLLLVDVGSILWLIAGRNWAAGTTQRMPVGRRAARDYPDGRPGRAATNPDDDEEFLRHVRARAEAQRRQYQDRQRAERDAEQRRSTQRPEDEV